MLEFTEDLIVILQEDVGMVIGNSALKMMDSLLKMMDLY